MPSKRVVPDSDDEDDLQPLTMQAGASPSAPADLSRSSHAQDDSIAIDRILDEIEQARPPTANTERPSFASLNAPAAASQDLGGACTQPAGSQMLGVRVDGDARDAAVLERSVQVADDRLDQLKPSDQRVSPSEHAESAVAASSKSASSAAKSKSKSQSSAKRRQPDDDLDFLTLDEASTSAKKRKTATTSNAAISSRAKRSKRVIEDESEVSQRNETSISHEVPTEVDGPSLPKSATSATKSKRNKGTSARTDFRDESSIFNPGPKDPRPASSDVRLQEERFNEDKELRSSQLRSAVSQGDGPAASSPAPGRAASPLPSAPTSTRTTKRGAKKKFIPQVVIEPHGVIDEVPGTESTLRSSASGSSRSKLSAQQTSLDVTDDATASKGKAKGSTAKGRARKSKVVAPTPDATMPPPRASEQSDELSGTQQSTESTRSETSAKSKSQSSASAKSTTKGRKRGKAAQDEQEREIEVDATLTATKSVASDATQLDVAKAAAELADAVDVPAVLKPAVVNRLSEQARPSDSPGGGMYTMNFASRVGSSIGAANLVQHKAGLSKRQRVPGLLRVVRRPAPDSPA